MKIFKLLTQGHKITNTGSIRENRKHRGLAKTLGLAQIYADSALSDAQGLYSSSQSLKLKCGRLTILKIAVILKNSSI